MDFIAKLVAVIVIMVLFTWAIVSAAPFIAILLVLFLYWVYNDSKGEGIPDEE